MYYYANPKGNGGSSVNSPNAISSSSSSSASFASSALSASYNDKNALPQHLLKDSNDVDLGEDAPKDANGKKVSAKKQKETSFAVLHSSQVLYSLFRRWWQTANYY